MNPAPATSATTLPLECYGPVSLDELLSEAELLERVDRKYIVSATVAERLLQSLDPRNRVLEIDGAREFAYDSVYFDTPCHLSYRLTAQRRRRRFKLRTRTYLDTGGTFLEVKTKGGRGQTVKHRIGYDPQDRDRLTLEGATFARAALARQGHDPALVGRMLPMLVSRYRRATMLLPGGSRATFDTCVSWAVAGIGGAQPSGGVSLTGHVIVESKSRGTASEVDRWLWLAGHRPSGISKFGTGTAALHPELPRNKWARQLRGPYWLEAAPDLEPRTTKRCHPGTSSPAAPRPVRPLHASEANPQAPANHDELEVSVARPHKGEMS